MDFKLNENAAVGGHLESSLREQIIWWLVGGGGGVEVLFHFNSSPFTLLV